jgi:chemotaxis protein methyltransferase CheR
VTPPDYDFLRQVLKQRSGLALSADKHYFLESRLLPLARQAGLNGLGELVLALKTGRDTALLAAVVEAMTTNESFFFRDKTPFEHFRRVIMPALLAARWQSRALRIWCAAAASGQEPYSIAMCLREMARAIAGWRIEILATDLSGAVLDRARQGLYSQFEVQRGLPIKLLVKYFTQVGELWQIAPEVRAMVKYRRFNLLTDFASLGTFDVILCRNVLIYFDQDTKSDPCGSDIERRLSCPRCDGNRDRLVRSVQNGDRQTGSLHGQRPQFTPSGAARNDAGAAPPDSYQRRPIKLISTSKSPGRKPGLRDTKEEIRLGFWPLLLMAPAARSRGPIPSRCNSCHWRRWRAFSGACK